MAGPCGPRKGCGFSFQGNKEPQRDFNLENSVIYFILQRRSLSGIEEVVRHGEDGIHR